jgi:hypothetical protein
MYTLYLSSGPHKQWHPNFFPNEFFYLSCVVNHFFFSVNHFFFGQNLFFWLTTVFVQPLFPSTNFSVNHFLFGQPLFIRSTTFFRPTTFFGRPPFSVDHLFRSITLFFGQPPSSSVDHCSCWSTTFYCGKSVTLKSIGYSVWCVCVWMVNGVCFRVCVCGWKVVDLNSDRPKNKMIDRQTGFCRCHVLCSLFPFTRNISLSLSLSLLCFPFRSLLFLLCWFLCTWKEEAFHVPRLFNMSVHESTQEKQNERNDTIPVNLSVLFYLTLTLPYHRSTFSVGRVIIVQNGPWNIRYRQKPHRRWDAPYTMRRSVYGKTNHISSIHIIR